jgi:hypothetical protein
MQPFRDCAVAVSPADHTLENATIDVLEAPFAKAFNGPRGHPVEAIR